MQTIDKIVTGAALLCLAGGVIFGGMFYPNTLAGKVSAFFFSFN